MAALLDFLLDRCAVAAICRRIRRSPEVRADFAPALTMVYRTALPPEEGLRLESPGRPAQTLRRGLLSYLGIDLRLYWVDADPMVDFERPAAYACFRGPFPSGWQRVDAPVRIGGQPLAQRGTDPAFTVPIDHTARLWALLTDTAAGGGPTEGRADLCSPTSSRRPTHCRPMSRPLPPAGRWRRPNRRTRKASPVIRYIWPSA